MANILAYGDKIIGGNTSGGEVNPEDILFRMRLVLI